MRAEIDVGDYTTFIRSTLTRQKRKERRSHSWNLCHFYIFQLSVLHTITILCEILLSLRLSNFLFFSVLRFTLPLGLSLYRCVYDGAVFHLFYSRQHQMNGFKLLCFFVVAIVKVALWDSICRFSFRCCFCLIAFGAFFCFYHCCTFRLSLWWDSVFRWLANVPQMRHRIRNFIIVFFSAPHAHTYSFCTAPSWLRCLYKFIHLQNNT